MNKTTKSVKSNRRPLGAPFAIALKYKRMIAAVVLALFALNLVVPDQIFAQGMGGGMGGGDQPATQKTFTEASDDSKLVVVVEVQKVDSAIGSADCVLLEKKSEELYLRTKQPVTVHWEQKTRFIMGDSSDVSSGGVIRAKGAKSGIRVEAKQVVVLTGYVKVK